MASTGKSKRRVKGKTLDLNSFLANDQDAPSGFAVVNTHYDWGDVMEDAPVDDKFTLDYKKDSRIFLPTAPKAARGPDIDMSRIPTKPPFTAYVGNLPYDVNEDDIIKFFRQLKVTSVRLPREGGGERGRLRGFGYAEFADKQSLIEALALNNETLKNRAIRVNLAGDHENERDHDRRDDRSDRTAGDWRAGGRDDGFSRDDRQRNGTWYDRNDRGGRGGRRDMDSRDDFEWRKDRDNYNRRDDRGGYERRERGFDRRDYGNRERDAPKERPRLQLKPRSVPLEQSSVSSSGSSAIFGGAKPVDTAAKEREIEERLSRQKGTAEQRPRSYSDEDPNTVSSSILPGKTLENHVTEISQNKETKEHRTKQSGASMATIFGDAKPVDTAAREREIEERLAKERDEQTRKLNPDQDRISSSSRPPASTRTGRYEGRSSSKQEGGDRGPRTGSRGRQGYYNRDNTDNYDNSSDKKENYGRRSSRDEDSDRKYQNQSSRSRGRADRGTSGNRGSQDRDGDGNESKEHAMPHYHEEKPPVYTSTNKFVHLMHDDDDDDVDNESTSE